MPTDIQLKEEFVSGHTGTSWLEVVLITCVFPCGRLLYAVGTTSRTTMAESWFVPGFIWFTVERLNDAYE